MDEDLLRKVLGELLEPIKQDIREMKQDISGLKEDVSGLKAGQKELYCLVSAIDERTKVMSAEQENMKNTIVHMQGDISTIKKDISAISRVVINNTSEIIELKQKLA